MIELNKNMEGLMKEITITYRDKNYKYPEDTTLLDISKDFEHDFTDKIIIGEINGRINELSSKIKEDSKVNFYDYNSNIGNRVYESGLIFVLAKAFKDVLKADIEVKYSIDKGIYIWCVIGDVCYYILHWHSFTYESEKNSKEKFL